MVQIKLIEITQENEHEFIQVQLDLYQNDEHYIRPIDEEIHTIFNPQKNRFLRKGKAKRWIALFNNKRVGRIAAFHSPDFSFKAKHKVGGMGFFDCVNDQDIANKLLATAQNWLAEEGFEGMEGPINFGERNSWWGVLIDGFIAPVYQMNYNYPYYQELLETYGFQLYFKQFSFGFYAPDGIPHTYKERSKRVLANKDYTFRTIEMNKLEKYADDFKTVYNKAWGNHQGFKGMSKGQAIAMMKKMKPIIIEHLMWFGYYKEDPVAIYLNLPDLNQYFKHVNGKLDWIGKFKVGWHQWRKTNRKFFGLVFGVIPEHQGKGVEGAIIEAAGEVLCYNGRWDWTELIWIGDFNPKMLRVAENMGAKVIKTHHTYRYNFDTSIPVERHKIIG